MHVLNVVVAILNTFCNVTLKLKDAQLKTRVHYLVFVNPDIPKLSLPQDYLQDHMFLIQSFFISTPLTAPSISAQPFESPVYS